MRAFLVKQLNHPSKIELTRDAPEPEPVPDQILVEVYSAGLNFYDVSTRNATTPPYPSFYLGKYEIEATLFSFLRFCRLRGNTRVDRNSRSFWVQSFPV